MRWTVSAVPGSCVQADDALLALGGLCTGFLVEERLRYVGVFAGEVYMLATVAKETSSKLGILYDQTFTARRPEWQ